MKIYTEIIYEFKDGELIEIDSDSFEYEGELLLCEGSGDVEDVTEAATELIEEGQGDEEEEEEEEDEEDELGESRGFGAPIKGYNPYLSIKTKTGEKGFTRGSLRVRKPRPMAVN